MSNKVYNKPVVNIERGLDWQVMNKVGAIMTRSLNEKFGTDFKVPTFSFDYFNRMCKRVGEDPWYAQCSCGSLGGGM